MSQDRLLKAQKILKDLDDLKKKTSILEKEIRTYILEEEFFKNESYKNILEESTKVLLGLTRNIA